MRISTPTTLATLSQALSGKQISAVELATDYLAAAKADQLNAFLHIDDALTLAQARHADTLLAGPAAQCSPLTGIPVAHKDIFVTRGWRSTAGSAMLANYISPFDAAVVEKLGQAGMVTLGKLGCDEFAMGSSNENTPFGAVKNPWDTLAIPGGSSGASAAVVAAGLAPVATGTDTGGSIRQPAAMCGVTGIKPTYGTISRYGMIAYASSLDQAGPIARTALDCAMMLNAMAGVDARDATSVERPVEDFTRRITAIDTTETSARPLAGLRIGLPKEYFSAGLAADVEQAIRTALGEFEKLGATLVDISLPKTELSIPSYYVIAPAEASSNLSRFDGVRYGHRAAQYKDLGDMYSRSRAEGFGAEVKRRILIGAYVLSQGYYDAYYLQAQRIRRLIAEDFQRVLTGPDAVCDVIMAPVSPTVAWNIGDKADDPVANYLADIYTLSTSMAGLPGMSVPCGFGSGPVNSRRPVGLQIIGNYFDEARMLELAHRYQQVTDWHLRTPQQQDR